MTLATLQKEIACAIARREPVGTTSESKMWAQRTFDATPLLAPEARIDIYRDQFATRHAWALGEDLRASKHWIGEERFTSFASAFLASHPPSHFSLNDLARRAPGFAKETAPWCSDPVFCDLVSVEEAFLSATEAKDPTPFDPSVLANVEESAWPSKVIRFQPALRLIDTRFDVMPYRMAIVQRKTPATPVQQATHLVIARAGTEVTYLAVERDAWLLIELLANATPLGNACELIAAKSDAKDLAQRLEVWFAQWVAWGWIEGIL